MRMQRMHGRGPRNTASRGDHPLAEQLTAERARPHLGRVDTDVDVGLAFLQIEENQQFVQVGRRAGGISHRTNAS